MVAKRSKPKPASKPATVADDVPIALLEWIAATVTPSEGFTTKYQQRYDWAALMELGQGLPLTLARLNARVCASQTLRLYRAGPGSEPSREVRGKQLRHLESGRAGFKAAEWATSGGDAEEITDHEVLRLLNRPSPWHTGRQIAEQGFVYRQITGNSFDQLMGDTKKPPIGLLPMMPWFVVIQPDDDQFILGYWYDRSRTQGQWLDPAEVLHRMHVRSEVDPYAGEGWLSNVRAEAKILATDAGFDITFAERGYQPPFAVQFDDAYDKGRAKEMLEFFKATFAGWTRMVTPLFLWKGKYQATQTVPKDLQSLEKLRERQLAIMAAAGVPESMYRLNDANLASAQQGYSVQYLDSTIRTMINSDAEQLTERLLPRWGIMPGEMWFAYDDPVPQNEAADSTRMLAEVAAGVRTIDEYRSERGMEPMPRSSVSLRSDFPVVSGANPQAALPPGKGDAQVVPGQPGVEAVADTGLNGAQIDALQTMLLSIVEGTQSADVVRDLVAAAFPTIDPALIDRMVANAAAFEATKPDPEPVEVAAPASPAAAEPAAKRYRPDTIKAAGWWATPPGCCGHGEKTALPPGAEGLERDMLAWYETIIRDQARTVAGGKPPVIPDSGLEAIFERHLPELLSRAAASEAGAVGVSDAPSFATDVSRVLQEYVPALSREIRQTTAARLAEIQTVVGDALRAGAEQGASIDEIAEQISALAPEEAGYLAERVARTETAYASTQGRMIAWHRAGIAEKEWLLAPGACPVCADLAARVTKVAASEPFARAGETFGGYTLTRDCYGPPLHPNDRCSMIPVVEGFTDA